MPERSRLLSLLSRLAEEYFTPPPPAAILNRAAGFGRDYVGTRERTRWWSSTKPTIQSYGLDDAQLRHLISTARLRFDHLVAPRLEEGFRLARWLIGNATDAEDVTQEASLRAWRAIDSASDANGRAWFLVIVRNTCYSWLKRHKSHMLVSSEDLDQNDRIAFENGGFLGTPTVNPEAALISRDEARTLAEAIDALPLPLREALVLREYHDLSYREIAAISEAPIGTVMSRLARARRQLLSAVGKDA